MTAQYTYMGNTEIWIGDRDSFYYKKKATIVSKSDFEGIWYVRIGNVHFPIQEKHMTIGLPPKLQGVFR